VGVRIRDAILYYGSSNVQSLTAILLFSMFPDLRNNLKSSGSSLYECSISYSILNAALRHEIRQTLVGANDAVDNFSSCHPDLPGMNKDTKLLSSIRKRGLLKQVQKRIDAPDPKTPTWRDCLRSQ
jgi:hypothetical protein